MYTQNYYEKNFAFYKKIYNYIKNLLTTQFLKNFVFSLNIRMLNQGLNLSLNEFGLKAKYRNISDYEN